MIRLAEYLSKDYKINIYTKAKSYIAMSYVPINNITIKYDLGQVNNDFFIISSKYLLDLYNNIKNKDIDIFIWQLQPIELITQFFPARRFNKEIKIYNKLIDKLYRPRRELLAHLLKEYYNENKLFFMDSDNYNTSNKYLGLNLDEINYIPVAVPFESIHLEDRPKINKNLTFCVVSRISYDFKFYSILNFIKSLEKYIISKKISINLEVVGSGDALNELITYAEQSKINFTFHGIVPIDDVYKNIYPKIDICFGMGTSLIDSSKYKIPTIITNISSKHDSEYTIKYSMFYESIGFSLGSYNNNGKRPLNELLDEIIIDLNKHGYMCYLYAKENHSSEIIFNKIKSIISNSRINPNLNKLSDVMDKRKNLDTIYNKIILLFRILKNLLRKIKLNIKSE
ncbi:hypothetical protein [Providencia sneebia]|nr:hypothetical protein [Providencia sneebia]